MELRCVPVGLGLCMVSPNKPIQAPAYQLQAWSTKSASATWVLSIVVILIILDFSVFTFLAATEDKDAAPPLSDPMNMHIACPEESCFAVILHVIREYLSKCGALIETVSLVLLLRDAQQGTCVSPHTVQARSLSIVHWCPPCQDAVRSTCFMRSWELRFAAWPQNVIEIPAPALLKKTHPV